MKYGYTDINELQVSVHLSLHDIDRLRRCIAEFEPAENVWFFKRFKEVLRECQKQAATSMQTECQHIKRELENENV
jgi:predicted component of type VI protein secretion system